eukprot:jgi/Mesvir1/28273/Mv24228-RA.1
MQAVKSVGKGSSAEAKKAERCPYCHPTCLTCGAPGAKASARPDGHHAFFQSTWQCKSCSLPDQATPGDVGSTEPRPPLSPFAMWRINRRGGGPRASSKFIVWLPPWEVSSERERWSPDPYEPMLTVLDAPSAPTELLVARWLDASEASEGLQEEASKASDGKDEQGVTPGGGQGDGGMVSVGGEPGDLTEGRGAHGIDIRTAADDRVGWGGPPGGSGGSNELAAVVAVLAECGLIRRASGNAECGTAADGGSAGGGRGDGNRGGAGLDTAVWDASERESLLAGSVSYDDGAGCQSDHLQGSAPEGDLEARRPCAYWAPVEVPPPVYAHNPVTAGSAQNVLAFRMPVFGADDGNEMMAAQDERPPDDGGHVAVAILPPVAAASPPLKGISPPVAGVLPPVRSSNHANCHDSHPVAVGEGVTVAASGVGAAEASWVGVIDSQEGDEIGNEGGGGRERRVGDAKRFGRGHHSSDRGASGGEFQAASSGCQGVGVTTGGAPGLEAGSSGGASSRYVSQDQLRILIKEETSTGRDDTTPHVGVGVGVAECGGMKPPWGHKSKLGNAKGDADAEDGRVGRQGHEGDSNYRCGAVGKPECGEDDVMDEGREEFNDAAASDALMKLSDGFGRLMPGGGNACVRGGGDKDGAPRGAGSQHAQGGGVAAVTAHGMRARSERDKKVPSKLEAYGVNKREGDGGNGVRGGAKRQKTAEGWMVVRCDGEAESGPHGSGCVHGWVGEVGEEEPRMAPVAEGRYFHGMLHARGQGGVNADPGRNDEKDEGVGRPGHDVGLDDACQQGDGDGHREGRTNGSDDSLDDGCNGCGMGAGDDAVDARRHRRNAPDRGEQGTLPLKAIKDTVSRGSAHHHQAEVVRGGGAGLPVKGGSGSSGPAEHQQGHPRPKKLKGSLGTPRDGRGTGHGSEGGDRPPAQLSRGGKGKNQPLAKMVRPSMANGGGPSGSSGEVTPGDWGARGASSGGRPACGSGGSSGPGDLVPVIEKPLALLAPSAADRIAHATQALRALASDLFPSAWNSADVDELANALAAVTGRLPTSQAMRDEIGRLSEESALVGEEAIKLRFELGSQRADLAQQEEAKQRLTEQIQCQRRQLEANGEAIEGMQRQLSTTYVMWVPMKELPSTPKNKDIADVRIQRSMYVASLSVMYVALFLLGASRRVPWIRPVLAIVYFPAELYLYAAYRVSPLMIDSHFETPLLHHLARTGFGINGCRNRILVPIFNRQHVHADLNPMQAPSVNCDYLCKGKASRRVLMKPCGDLSGSFVVTFTKRLPMCSMANAVCLASAMCSEHGRLHKRKAVSSSVAECRAVVSAVLHARYLNHLLVWLQHQAGSYAGVKSHLLTDSQSLLSFLDNPLAVHTDLDWIVLKQECTYLESKTHIRDPDNAADALTKVPQAAGPQYRVLYTLMNPYNGRGCLTVHGGKSCLLIAATAMPLTYMVCRFHKYLPIIVFFSAIVHDGSATTIHANDLA